MRENFLQLAKQCVSGARTSEHPANASLNAQLATAAALIALVERLDRVIVAVAEDEDGYPAFAIPICGIHTDSRIAY